MFFSDNSSLLESGFGGYGSRYDDSELMDIVNAIPVEECYDEPVSAVMRFVYENEVNYNNICNSINMQQLSYMRENAGEMMVLSEGAVKDIIDKFVAFLERMIEKIKGQVMRVVEWIDRQCDYNKQWVKAKEDKLLKAKDAKIEVRGYEFTNLDVASANAIYKKLGLDEGNMHEGIFKTVLDNCHPSNIEKTAKEDLEDIQKVWKNKDNIAKAKNNTMSKITGKDSTAKTFGDDLKKYFRNGGNEITITSFDASNIIAELKVGKDAKYKVKAAYESFAKELAKAIKSAKSTKKKIGPNAANRNLILDCLNYYIAVVKSLSEIGHRVYQAQVNAIMANFSQYRKIANAAIKEANSNTKGMKESYELFQDFDLM